MLRAMPMLEYDHSEASSKQAGRQHIWEEEMNQLINGPMAQIAQCVWAGHFQVIKRRLLEYLVAKTFHDSGLCLMTANISVPTNGVASKYNTWAVFCKGDMCVCVCDQHKHS